MKILLNKILSISIIFILGFSFLTLNSCKKDYNDNEVKVYEYREQIGKKIKELTDLLSDAQFGYLKDEYPEESRSILELGISDLKKLLEEIKTREVAVAGIPAETAKRIAYANSQVEAFQATKRIEDFLLAAELYVDGRVGGHIDFGSAPELSDFSNGGTVEFWVKFEELSGFNWILSSFTNEPQFRGWGANYYGHDGHSLLRMTYSLEGNNLFEPGIPSFKILNQWIHLAYVWNPNAEDDHSDVGAHTFKMYVNGELQKYENWGNKVLEAPGAGAHLYGMNRPNNHVEGATTDGGTAGYMKHVHLWNTVKSPAQIKAIMDNKELVTGGEADLIGGWELDVIPRDNNSILDLTGKHTAKLGGNYRWEPK